MKIIPHRAFGYVVIENIFESFGEESDNPLWSKGPQSSFEVDALWLTSQGQSKFTEINTNQVVSYFEGDFTPEPEDIIHGTWQYEAAQIPTTVFCLDTNGINENLNIYDVQKFTLLNGNSVNLDQNTKLFLAKGSLLIDGTTHTGCKQIKLSSGAKTLTATSNCYGFIFP